MVLVLAGIGIAVCAHISIKAAYGAGTRIRRRWEEIRATYGDQWKCLPELGGGGDDAIVQKGKLPAVYTPLIIVLGWLIIGYLTAEDWQKAKQMQASTTIATQHQPSHECGQPIQGDISKLTEAQVIQELACSAENTELLRAESQQPSIARHHVHMAARVLFFAIVLHAGWF